MGGAAPQQRGEGDSVVGRLDRFHHVRMVAHETYAVEQVGRDGDGGEEAHSRILHCLDYLAGALAFRRAFRRVGVGGRVCEMGRGDVYRRWEGAWEVP